jgi:hypothetical protein
MQVLEATLSGLVEWSIHKSDPPVIPLDSLPGWFLINPLLYPELASDNNHAPYWMEALYNDAVTLKTNAMFMATHQSIDQSIDNDMGQFDFAFFPDFLSSLRLVSKQVELARIHYGGASWTAHEKTLPDTHFPDPAPNNSLYISNYRLQTAITMKHIKQADSNVLNGYFPVHAMMLLDAILAFLDRDDRRAIIYAAMSIELIAERKIYEAGKPKGKGPPRESTVERLLHRQSFETLSRSLRQDNLPLYQMIEKLYRTRNKLVHEGHVPVSDEFFQIDSIEARALGKDALFAIRYANEVFKWFGENDDFIPKPGHIVVSFPMGRQPVLSPFPMPLPRLGYAESPLYEA